MKKGNIFLILFILLAVAGVLAYLVIWYRKRSGSATNENSDTSDTNSGTYTPGLQTGDQKPTGDIENPYEWYKKNLGYAAYPLKLGSKGVNVKKVQEHLNTMTIAQKPYLALLDEDGIWGQKTNDRFKLFFPNYTSVDKLMFSTTFDPYGYIE